MLHSALINVMVKAARRAGRSLKHDLGEIEHLQVSLKGPANFVSLADKRAEEMLYADLSKARPGYGFIGEEGGTREGADKSHTWIVDPLDGTTNFLHGIPQFAISIALAREGVVVAGVIYNPANDELYTAERGKGAFLNDQRLRVEKRALAAFGGIELVIGRVIDHARDHDALARQRDRDGKLRDAVQKIGGAVERIDDPGVGFVGALARAAFLADETVARPRLGKVGVEHLFGALVGKRDEIGRPLQRNLQMLDLPEIVLQAAAGAARGLDHDVDEGGVQHQLGKSVSAERMRRRGERSGSGCLAIAPPSRCIISR